MRARALVLSIVGGLVLNNAEVVCEWSQVLDKLSFRISGSLVFRKYDEI